MVDSRNFRRTGESSMPHAGLSCHWADCFISLLPPAGEGARRADEGAFFPANHEPAINPMKIHRFAHAIAVFLLLALPLASTAQSPAKSNAEKNNLHKTAEQAPANTATTVVTDVPLAEIQRYVQVYRSIRNNYVEPISDTDLMRAALRGLLADIDPHSSYLEAEQAQSFSEFAAGSYEGIGIETDESDPTVVKVIAPIDDTPAQKAGLRSGDRIIAIDGRAVDNRSPASDSNRLRGKPGTTVTVTLLREGEQEPLEIAIRREVIRVLSVRSRMLEPGYAYLRLSAFQADTGAELRAALEKLQGESGGLHGLVLDLRSNGGGLLVAAVEAADAFLDSGVIVSTRGRNVLADNTFSAKPGDLLRGAPMVVLIDAGSASASEVLAGALHDSGRALLMGSRSFGKGSVQSVIELDNGDAVKLTTSRYYTPSGKSIQGTGIAPDVSLPGTTISSLREQDLPGHLHGTDETDDGFAHGVIITGEDAIKSALARLKTDVASRGVNK